MTIDLSQFLDKEVIVTNNLGHTRTGTLSLGEKIRGYAYKLHTEYGQDIHYNENGYCFTPNDPELYKIKTICLKKPMTIDLSQFVDKEVTVTLRGSEEYVATIKKHDNPNISYPFYFRHPFGEQINYTQSGCHGYRHLDIIKIEHHYTKPMKTTELPESTIEKLAEVLSPDAVKYITGTEEYVTFMSEMLSKFVRERMGNLNPEVECELVTAMGVNKIELRSVK